MRIANILGIGIIMAVCLFTSTTVNALTDEEMLRRLDERFVAGEISEETYKELKAKYSEGKSGSKESGAAENLVTNGSFEEPFPKDPNLPDGWYKKETAGTLTWEGGGHDGGKCIVVGNTMTSEAYWATEIEVKPNTKYKLSYWYKTEGAQELRVPEVLFPKSFGKDWDNYTKHSPEWTKFEKVINSRDTEGTIRVEWIMDGPGKLYIDEVSITEE